MNDAQFEKTKDKIDVLVDYWIPVLGLDNWQFTCRYYRDDYHVPGDPLGDARSWAYCIAKWQYMEAEIGFDILKLSGASEYAIEETVVHELMHVMVSEVRRRPDVGDMNDGHNMDHEERVATMLSRAFLRLKKKLTAEPEAEPEPEPDRKEHDGERVRGAGEGRS